MRSLQEVFLEAREAVSHGDAGPAYRLLQELRQLRASSQFGAELGDGKLDELERVLHFVALPALSAEEAAEILRTAILPLLGLGIDLDDRLSIRQTFVTYGEKDTDRQVLKQAILENTEKVGTLTIAEWLKSFDKAYSPETRERRAVQDFFTHDSRIVALSEREKIVLKIILNAYENWLSKELLSVFDMAYLKANPQILSETGAAGPYASQGANVAHVRNRVGAKSSGGPAKLVRLPLLKAMSEYRHLSEQLITNEKIKLRASPEMVRPSLGNWLRSYREEIGIGFHETAQRGNFLFQSQNGKRLSNGERARINLILKSVEEEYPLEIDITHETIIFPPSGDASMELTQIKAQPMNSIIRPRGLPTDSKSIHPSANSATQAVVSDTQKPAVTQSFKPFFKKITPPEKNVSGKTLHFSTGHVLPAEREAGTLPEGTNAALRQMQQPTQGIQREPRNQPTNSPYSIRPLRSRNGGNGDI